MTSVAQRLFSRPKYEPVTVKLEEIEPPESTVRSATDQSVDALGMASSVVLEPLEHFLFKYRIVDGGRRVRSAAKSGDLEIPALLVPKGTTPAQIAALTLVSNTARSSNFYEEAIAAERVAKELREEGLAPDMIPLYIGKMLGIHSSKVRQRLALVMLPNPIKDAIKDGRIGKIVAGKLANDPAALQKKAAQRLADLGKLTLESYRELKLGAAQQSPIKYAEPRLERIRREIVGLKEFMGDGEIRSRVSDLMQGVLDG